MSSSSSITLLPTELSSSYEWLEKVRAGHPQRRELLLVEARKALGFAFQFCQRFFHPLLNRECLRHDDLERLNITLGE